MQTNVRQVYDPAAVKDMLLSLGYSLQREPKGWRTNATFRGGSNRTSLFIFDGGNYYDFTTGESGGLKKLIAQTVGTEKANHYLKALKNNVRIIKKKEIKPEIIMPKVFQEEKYLKDVIFEYDYWNGRGISTNLIKKFKGGVIKTEGKFKNRFVFPVYDGKKQLVGMAGRLLIQSETLPKWKLLGDKKEWKYPLFLNHECIYKEKSIIFVESIGDMLALMERGIYNIAVTFGLDISFTLLNVGLRYNLDYLYIAFNNDASGSGNNAAIKMRKKLLYYFDPQQVKIALPDNQMDFGEMLLKNKQLIHQWKAKNILTVNH